MSPHRSSCNILFTAHIATITAETLSSSISACADLVGLAGCVATANRKTHGCPLSLKDFDAMEQGIFETMITKASAPCPSMPDDFKVQLANHMTIQQLIIKLDQLYRTFIVKHWKPKALARMAPKVADTWAALTHLGPDVDTLETGHVLQHLNEQVGMPAN